MFPENTEFNQDLEVYLQKNQPRKALEQYDAILQRFNKFLKHGSTGEHYLQTKIQMKP